MPTTVEDPRLRQRAPEGEPDALLRADEPAPHPARGGRGLRYRLSFLLSLGVHVLALGLAFWLGLRGPPTPVAVGSPLTLAQVEPAADLVPVVEVDLPEDVEAIEPFEVQPVLPQPETAEPDEVFEPEDLTRPLPEPLTEVPLRVVRLRVARPKPPEITQRPPPRPALRRPAAAPVRPPPRPRAAPRPGPMRVVYRPDVNRYYPYDAQRRGATGVVTVRIIVDAHGIVTDATVVASSGDSSLDAAGVRLARAYRFSPGVGLRSARIPITFQML